MDLTQMVSADVSRHDVLLRDSVPHLRYYGVGQKYVYFLHVFRYLR